MLLEIIFIALSVLFFTPVVIAVVFAKEIFGEYKSHPNKQRSIVVELLDFALPAINGTMLFFTGNLKKGTYVQYDH